MDDSDISFFYWDYVVFIFSEQTRQPYQVAWMT